MPPRTTPALLDLPHVALVKYGHVFDPAKHAMLPGTRLVVSATDVRYLYAPPETPDVTALVTGDGTEHIVGLPFETVRELWARTLGAQTHAADGKDD